MRDELTLLVLLWCIYASELGIWVPMRAVLFRKGQGRTFRTAEGFPGNAKGCLHWNHIFPYFQQVYLTQQAPLALSTKAVANQTGQSWAGSGKGSSANLTAIRYDQIESLKRDGSILFINGKRFVDCLAEMEAKESICTLEALKAATEEKRAELVGGYYKSRLSPDKDINEHLGNLNKATQKLRILCSGLFLYALVLCPILYAYYPAPHTLLYYLLSSVLFGWLISAEYFLLHRKLFPKEGAKRVQTLLKQSFCFPIAIGACKDITLKAKAAFDPIAMGKVILNAESYEDLCRLIWLDLKYPTQTAMLSVEATAHQEETRNHLIEATRSALEANGISIEKLETPASLDPGTVCFCPRCFSEYQKERATCTDCSGISTKAIS